jgi:leucyl aminopeptidase
MDITQVLIRLLRRSKKPEALQIDKAALQIAQSASKALESERIIEEKTTPQALAEVQEFSPSIELQKESLQLGIAAGYTSKLLREIESSLIRIESQMITKDWFSSKSEKQTPQLVEIMKQHDENEQKRFEAIQNSLNSFRSIAQVSPEPMKSELFQEIEKIESQLPLTGKMKEVLQIVKEVGEISYDDLAKKLNLTEVSGLRGLLSNMVKRTDQIERFERDRKGWIRHKKTEI